ncbi:MAG: Hsp70 family protein [Verrucomicrobiia bacterium]
MTTLELLVPEIPTPALPQAPIRVLGIDLGTTNSTIAEVIWSPDSHVPPVACCHEVEQPTATGAYIHVLVPSVVAIHDGQIWIGEGAKRLRANASLRRGRDIFYECKNDIGVRRTYHLAPEGFRSAPEIAGKVLAFLAESARNGEKAPLKRTVVTVPASFQLAQRADTLRAIEMAGLKSDSGDLLDEPVAAFLDYLISHQNEIFNAFDKESNLVVFDFGGGTCDVAVFRFNPRGRYRRMEISSLAVSRYHRLGGGDLDAAIVHQILIPQLLEQEGLPSTALSYEDRKLHIEPALLSVAESLKVGLCIEISRLQQLGKYENADRAAVVKTQPGSYPCPCPTHPLVLKSPRLSAGQLDMVLKPYLDTELLYARETEYHLTCSIFAPMQDALDRAGLKPSDVHLCLLIGGSSLIPQVQAAISSYFASSRILAYEDRESTQVAVARGAAYHALALALCGHSLIQPVASDSISIRTSSGLFTLVPRGAQLPFPAEDNPQENLALVVPQTALVGSVPLRVEIVAGEEARPIYVGTWKIPSPVNRGEPLRLKFRLDENQALHLELTLADLPDEKPFSLMMENPLTNVVNPHAVRQQIDEVEENLRVGTIPSHQVPETLVSLAENYAELNQIDKAIYYLQQALRRKGRPDAHILNLLGIRYGEKADWEREEKMYREAFAANPQSHTPLFNLALSQINRGLAAEAYTTIQSALNLSKSGPCLVLAARINQTLGRAQLAQSALEESFKLFKPPPAMSDWELGWFLTAARMAGDESRLDDAMQERHRRSKRSSNIENTGILPEINPALQKL